jgi:hypothetical protein
MHLESSDRLLQLRDQARRLLAERAADLSRDRNVSDGKRIGART